MLENLLKNLSLNNDKKNMGTVLKRIDKDLSKEIDKARKTFRQLGIIVSDSQVLQLLTGKSFKAVVKGRKRKFEIDIRR